VRALVLVDPGGFTRHNLVSRAFCRLKGRERITRAIAPAFARWYLHHRNPHVAAILERAREHRTLPARVAVDAAIWRSFLDPEHDLRAIAARIAAPTLLVWGKRDPVLPARTDGRAARAALPHAEYVELDTGHEPFAEAPAEWLAAVQPFLARVAA
jgi:pimeloyl-ACP methyl ester carboxylesterase